MCRLLTIILFLEAVICFGQNHENVIIGGRVTNKKNQAIAGANVFAVGSYDGATTDSLGKFSFSTVKTDTINLQVTAFGYSPITIPLRSFPQNDIRITLTASENNIEEVVVKAGEFRLGNQQNAALTALDIVTTAGSMGNIIAALETLPGAQVAGENGRLMVRGGDPHETQTYINGIRVGQPYTVSGNNLPVRGRFSPMLFQGTNFSTGAYSAEFGNALSSILNLKTAKEPDEAKTDLSISAIGIGAGHTSRLNEKSSLAFNANYISLAPFAKIIKQNLDWTNPYQQWSGEAIYRQRSEKQALNIYASFASERLGFRDDHIDYGQNVETNIRSSNYYTNASYTKYLANNWKWDSGFGLGYFERDLHFSTFEIPTAATDLHIKNKFQKNVNSSLRYFFGIDYFYQRNKERFSSPEYVTPRYGFANNLAAGYGEVSYHIFDRLHADAGLRYTVNTQTRDYLEPRAALTFIADKKHSASLFYGLFHQQPTEDIQKFDPELPWQSAQYTILQYSYADVGKQLRVELFHKSYDRLVRFERGDPTFSRNYATDGYGKVNGLDVFWRDSRSIQNLQYWLSYSWTNARKLEKDYEREVQPPYVAEHYASLVAKYWIGAWRSQVGITNTFISGRPYRDLNQPGYVQSYTRPINTLSANWSYLISQQKIIHIAVSNLLGNEPIFGYQYAQRRNNTGTFDRQALTPTTKRFVFIGFFWTISNNKKDNQLDNL